VVPVRKKEKKDVFENPKGGKKPPPLEKRKRKSSVGGEGRRNRQHARQEKRDLEIYPRLRGGRLTIPSFSPNFRKRGRISHLDAVWKKKGKEEFGLPKC